MGDPRPRQTVLNLLLISIDSLRLDAVSRTNPRIRTPRFDSSSRDFCFTDRCFSVSSATRPVHTTLFTGLYPFEHGVTSQRSPAMRQGIPHLFELLAGQGYQVGAFSEAASIFSGLEYAPWISEWVPGAVERFLETTGPRLLFLHCWGTHAPYGAADGKALGTTARLLREGRRAQVLALYQRAVERVLESQIAPLLDSLDLGEWVVLILGDHGERWAAEEIYHGQTLDNAVLRVPLYLHLPGTGNPPLPGPLCSLVDLFPTLKALFDLQAGYRGYGRDLRREERPALYLAQIEPVATREESGPDEPLLVGRPPGGPQWALFDALRKFTWWEESGKNRLERTFTGEELPAQAGVVEYFTKAREQLVSASAYAHLPRPQTAEDRELDRRLRELGYL